MIDLFKYASDHNVSITISPMPLTTGTFNIKVRRGYYQMNTGISSEVADGPDDMILFVLDGAVRRLDEYIERCRKLNNGEYEVTYHE